MAIQGVQDLSDISIAGPSAQTSFVRLAEFNAYDGVSESGLSGYQQGGGYPENIFITNIFGADLSGLYTGHFIPVSGNLYNLGSAASIVATIYSNTILNSGNISGSTVSVQDDQYGVSWANSIDVPTKNAVYNRIQSIIGAAGQFTIGTSWSGHWIPTSNNVYDTASPSSIARNTYSNRIFTNGLEISGITSGTTITATNITAKNLSSSGLVSTGNISGQDYLPLTHNTYNIGAPGNLIKSIYVNTITGNKLYISGANNTINGSLDINGATQIVGGLSLAGGNIDNVQQINSSVLYASFRTITPTLIVNNTATITGNIYGLSTGIFNSLTVVDDPYAVSWNGSTGVPTKNAIYDKIESLPNQFNVGTNFTGNWIPTSNNAYDIGSPGSIARNTYSNRIFTNGLEINGLAEFYGNIYIDGYNIDGAQLITSQGVNANNLTVTDSIISSGTLSGVTITGQNIVSRNNITAIAGISGSNISGNRLVSNGVTIVNITGSTLVISGQTQVGTITAQTGVFNTLTVVDDPYAIGWNSSSGIPTKNAIFDKIESLSGLYLTTGFAILDVSVPPFSLIPTEISTGTAAATYNTSTLNAITASGNYKGKTIKFPGKHYVINDTWKIPYNHGLSIEGQGGGGFYATESAYAGTNPIYNTSRLVWTGPLDRPMIESSGCFTKIDGLTLQGKLNPDFSLDSGSRYTDCARVGIQVANHFNRGRMTMPLLTLTCLQTGMVFGTGYAGNHADESYFGHLIITFANVGLVTNAQNSIVFNIDKFYPEGVNTGIYSIFGGLFNVAQSTLLTPSGCLLRVSGIETNHSSFLFNQISVDNHATDAKIVVMDSERELNFISNNLHIHNNIPATYSGNPLFDLKGNAHVSLNNVHNAYHNMIRTTAVGGYIPNVVIQAARMSYSSDPVPDNIVSTGCVGSGYYTHRDCFNYYGVPYASRRFSLSNGVKTNMTGF